MRRGWEQIPGITCSQGVTLRNPSDIYESALWKKI